MTLPITHALSARHQTAFNVTPEQLHDIARTEPCCRVYVMVHRTLQLRYVLTLQRIVVSASEAVATMHSGDGRALASSQGLVQARQLVTRPALSKLILRADTTV